MLVQQADSGEPHVTQHATWGMAAKVARVVGGATPKTDNRDFWDGNIDWATPKDLSDLQGKIISSTPRKITDAGLRSCAAEVLPSGSVLFSSRAPIGHVAINSVPMATNQGFKSFVPGHDLDASFLYWWLDANRETLQAMGTGATFKEVSKAVVERIEIPLPPLEEQRRIAGILDQADALRRLRTRAQEKLNTLGQAIFHEMFGDKNSHAKWSSISLGSLVPSGDRINYGVVQPGEHDPNGVPLIRVADLSNPAVDFATIKKIGLKIDKDYSRSRLKGGEILIGCVGSIGTTLIAPDSYRGANIARAVARVPVDPSRCNPFYLNALLQAESVQRYFTQEVRLVAQPTLNIKQIRETSVILPPRSLQDEFAQRFDALQAARAEALKALVVNGALFTSLQHRAFRGEL